MINITLIIKELPNGDISVPMAVSEHKDGCTEGERIACMNIQMRIGHNAKSVQHINTDTKSDFDTVLEQLRNNGIDFDE